MQEFIVLIIGIAALSYLGFKFIAKNKSQNCDNCGLNDTNELKKH